MMKLESNTGEIILVKAGFRVKLGHIESNCIILGSSFGHMWSNDYISSLFGHGSFGSSALVLDYLL